MPDPARRRWEPSKDIGGFLAVTPEELRKEAAAAEFLSRIVSFAPDREWLSAKAAELRRLADRMEARSWAPHERGDDPPRKQ